MSKTIKSYRLLITCGAYRIEAVGPVRYSGSRDLSRPGSDSYGLAKYALRLGDDGRVLKSLDNAILQKSTWEGTWAGSSDTTTLGVVGGRPVLIAEEGAQWLDNGASAPGVHASAFELPFDQLAQFEVSGIPPNGWD